MAGTFANTTPVLQPSPRSSPGSASSSPSFASAPLVSLRTSRDPTSSSAANSSPSRHTPRSASSSSSSCSMASSTSLGRTESPTGTSRTSFPPTLSSPFSSPCSRSGRSSRGRASSRLLRRTSGLARRHLMRSTGQKGFLAICWSASGSGSLEAAAALLCDASVHICQDLVGQ